MGNNKTITLRDLYDYLKDEWEVDDETIPFIKNGFIDNNEYKFKSIVTLGRFDSPSHKELEEYFFSEAIWCLKNEPGLHCAAIMLNITNFMENAIKNMLGKHCDGRRN